MNYWQQRLIEAQDKLLLDEFGVMENILKKEYSIVMLKLLQEMESLYAAVLAEKEATNKVYLYQKYYKALEQVEKELKKLSKKEVNVLTEELEYTYQKAYELTGESAEFASFPFDPNELKIALSEQWAGDGMTYSQRIWNDNARLSETLKGLMTDAIIRGKSVNALTYELIEQNLLKEVGDDIKKAYRNANRIVRTELAHIRNVATLDWNIDNGYGKVSIYTAEDEKVCKRCNSLDGQIFDTKEERADPHLPVHPNCRCCYLTVLKEGA